MSQTNLSAPRQAVDAAQELATVTDFPGTWSLTGWRPPPGLLFETWHDIGRALGSLHKAMRWIVGDWINYGENTYGEKYAQALDEELFTYQDLRNIASVAARVPCHIRVTSLSWTHHRHVAHLPPNEQARWLDEAKREHWSSSELDRQVKTAIAPAGALPPKQETGHKKRVYFSFSNTEMPNDSLVIFEANEIQVGEKTIIIPDISSMSNVLCELGVPPPSGNGAGPLRQVTCPECGHSWVE